MKKYIFSLLSLLLFYPLQSFSQDQQEQPDEATQEETAQTEATEDKDAELKTGVIASQGSGAGSFSLEGSSDGSVPGDGASLVQASISETKRGSCELRLVNTHQKNTYAVSYEVQGTNSTGKKTFSRTGSATVKAGQSVTKSVTCPEHEGLRVVLKSGKKVG